MQAEAALNFRDASQEKKIGNSVEYDKQEYKRGTRAQTAKASEISKESLIKKDEKKKEKVEKRSAEKPEYRIKKSSSVEKGIGNAYRKEIAFESHKNSSNVNDYKPL